MSIRGKLVHNLQLNTEGLSKIFQAEKGMVFYESVMQNIDKKDGTIVVDQVVCAVPYAKPEVVWYHSLSVTHNRVGMMPSIFEFVQKFHEFCKNFSEDENIVRNGLYITTYASSFLSSLMDEYVTIGALADNNTKDNVEVLDMLKNSHYTLSLSSIVGILTLMDKIPYNINTYNAVKQLFGIVEQPFKTREEEALSRVRTSIKIYDALKQLMQNLKVN